MDFIISLNYVYKKQSDSPIV